MAKTPRTDLSHPALLGLVVLVFAGVLAYALASYSELENGTDSGFPAVMPRGMHPEAQEIANQPDSQLTKLEEQSSADDVAAIERDLNETILSGLDAESSKVLNELQGL